MAYLAIGLIGLVILAIVVTAVLWLWRKPGWMGFHGRTLWDWLGLLAVPVLVASGTLVLSTVQLRLESLRAQEQAIQVYLDHIVALDHSAVASGPIGRAQTRAVLTQVDGTRAARVLAFLDELDLIRVYVTGLEGISLAGADLKDLSLAGLDFDEADLARVDFEGAVLRGADFEDANLRFADFKGADLRNTDMTGARLSGADLNHADLRGADLTGAKGISEDDLSTACMDATTRLPADFDPVTAETAGCHGPVPDD